MGKATITSGGADGLYNISIKYDNAKANARLDTINSELDELNTTLIPQALDSKNAAKTQHEITLGYLNDYLASVSPAQFDQSISSKLTVQAMQTKSAYDEAQKAYNKLVLKATSLQKEKTKLQAVPEDEAAQAWCADLTEDLTGDVGLIDVGYEDKTIRIIRPHEIENAAYNATKDGIISSFFNQTAHQIYTNRAYLPAMAKWKPRYRTGTITALAGDSCSVDLDTYTSSQQNLDVDQSTSLSGVPIEYMTCNGNAFEIGDSVVVDFSLDWATPKVIGFMSNPRPCVQGYVLNFDVSGHSSYFPFGQQPSNMTIDTDTGADLTLSMTYAEQVICNEGGIGISLFTGTAVTSLSDGLASGVTSLEELDFNWRGVTTATQATNISRNYLTSSSAGTPTPAGGSTCAGALPECDPFVSGAAVMEQAFITLPGAGEIIGYSAKRAFLNNNYYGANALGYDNTNYETLALISFDYTDDLNYVLVRQEITTEITNTTTTDTEYIYTYHTITKYFTETVDNGISTIEQTSTEISGDYTQTIYIQCWQSLDGIDYTLGVQFPIDNHAPYFWISSGYKKT